MADHRSNVRTNSSDYPCLVENESACSFQLACSSGSTLFSASRCPAHELMDVYQTNCILFAQTAPWLSATWSSTTSSPIEIVARLNYAGICKFASRYALAHLDPRCLWQKTRNETVGRVIIASAPFLLIITPVIYTRAEGIRSDRELYDYSSNSTRVIIPEFTIHNSKSERRRIALGKGKAGLFIEEAVDYTAI